MSITYDVVSGKKIIPYLDDLAALRITVFRDFPYLYDGTAEYERDYLNIYVKSKESVIALVLDDGKVVGATTGLPLLDADPDFAKAFAATPYDLNTIFYFGESVLLPAYRGQGIGKKFFELREAHASSYARNTMTCFCAVDRPQNHPSRPKDYRPLDSFWRATGYEKVPSLVTRFSWLDIGASRADEKQMTFWIKKLRRG